MQTINLLSKVAPKETRKASAESNVKKENSDFDSALKDFEDNPEAEKETDVEKTDASIDNKENASEKSGDTKDNDGENNNVLGLLGVLAAQVVTAPQVLNVVSENATEANVGAIKGVESATDKPENAGDSDTTATRPIDPGYSKLVISNPKAEAKDSVSDQVLNTPLEEAGTEAENFANVMKTEGSTNVAADAKVEGEVLSQANPTDDVKQLDNDAEISLVSTEKTDVKPVDSKVTDNKAVKAENSETTVELNTDNAITVKDIARKDNFNEEKSETESGKDTDDKAFEGTIKAAALNDVSSTRKTDSISEPAKVNVAEQVSDAVSKAVDTGRTEVKIHLNPEELGGISIRIISQNGTLSVKISADSRETSQLIASSMSELSASMQDKGLTMDKAEVSYAGNNPLDTSTSQQSSTFQQSFQNNGNNQNPQQQSDWQIPKWTVAMDTKGKTATDAVRDTQAKKVEPIKVDDSNMSILV